MTCLLKWDSLYYKYNLLYLLEDSRLILQVCGLVAHTVGIYIVMFVSKVLQWNELKSATIGTDAQCNKRYIFMAPSKKSVSKLNFVRKTSKLILKGILYNNQPLKRYPNHYIGIFWLILLHFELTQVGVSLMLSPGLVWFGIHTNNY